MEVAIASPARSSAVVPTRRHHRILIIGGGTAGVTLAARLRRAGQSDIALLEPSEQHFYQPLWTLVGAGQVRIEDTVRAERDYIPAGVTWIRDAAASVFDTPARLPAHASYTERSTRRKLGIPGRSSGG